MTEILLLWPELMPSAGCLVADNLPEVGPDKYDKLTGLLNRIYGQVGTIREGKHVHALMLSRILAESLHVI